MSANLWVDDVRDPPDGGWVVARSACEAIAAIRAGAFTCVSLDHDLGDDASGTGHDVLVFIERRFHEGGILPPEIRVHSANPAARLRMEAGIQSLMRHATGGQP